MKSEDFDRLPWEPLPTEDVYGDEMPDISPCCGAALRGFKCKQYCQNCSSLVENCSGD